MNETLLFLSFMLPASLVLGFYDVLTRKFLKTGINEQLLLGLVFFISGIFLSLPLLFLGIPDLKSGFWLAFFSTAAINVFAQLFWYKAFKAEEASLVSPLRFLTPPLVLLTGYLTLGEVPTFPGALGVLMTIFGLWLLLKSDADFKNIQFSQVLKRKSVLLGLAGAASFAIAFPIDKKAVLASSALFFGSLVFVFMGILELLYFYFFNPERRLGFSLHVSVPMKQILFFAFVYALGAFLSFQALNYSAAAYAVSVKRLSSLWAVLLGGQLLAEENIARKLLAAVIMFFGLTITLVLG